MRAFVLAGGFATRLWPLTERRAKPLLPLAGKPILDHIVADIPTNIPVTISTNQAFAEDFQAWKKTQTRDNIEIIIEHTASDDHKLGALGAVAQWVEENTIEDDILLLTGDNYFGFSMADFVKRYQPETPLLAAYDIGSLEEAKRFGTVLLEEDTSHITAFEEKPTAPQSTLVSTGCSVLPKKALPILLEYAAEHPDNVGGIFEELLKRQWKIDCFVFTEPWFDIGSFSAYLAATHTLVGNAVMSETGQLEENTCEGSVVIGTGSTVKDCTLRNVVVFENCTLEDCVLEDCVIDNDCVLRGIDLHGQMLRRRTVLNRQT